MHEKIKKLIKGHEGCKNEIYTDSLGILTCGVGHALLPGSTVPSSVISIFFQEDLAQAERDFYGLIMKGILPENLSDVRHAVIIDMLFNLGRPRFLTFRNFLSALGKSDWQKAKTEMLDSKWARQVGGRARTLAKMMGSDQWPAEKQEDA